MNQLLGSAALWPIEFTLNQIVKSDRHLRSAVGQFDGQLLEVKTAGAAICIHLATSGIRLSAISSHDLGLSPTACVAAKASTLLELLLSTSDTAALSNPEIEISGDAQFVQSLFQNLKNLDIRWDDILAPWLGDHSTHLAKSTTDSITQWSRQSKASVASTVNDYLIEESKLLPAHSRLEQFTDSMDELRLRIDRAKARIERLNSILAD